MALVQVVPGSHLFWDPALVAGSDDVLRGSQHGARGSQASQESGAGWLVGRRHPATGAALEIEEVVLPEG